MAWNYFAGFDPKNKPFSSAEFNKKKGFVRIYSLKHNVFKKKYVKLNNSLKNL